VARPHVYRTEAVVLRRQDLGEADRILTLYTPRHGKVRAVAKGTRRPQSRLAGHLELFTRSTLLIAQGRDLDIITQAQTLDAFRGLRDDLLRLTCAGYVGEVLDRLTPEREENEPLFGLLVVTLGRLASQPHPERAVRLFEMQALCLLGHRPQLVRCAECQHLLEPVPSFYSPPAGGVLCPACGRRTPGARPLSLGAFKLLRLLQRNDYALLQRLRLSAALLDEVEELLRAQIESVAERTLRVPRLLQDVRMVLRPSATTAAALAEGPPGP